MEIKYISTYWGSTDLPIKEFTKKAKDAGFDGIELNVPSDKPYVKELQEALRENSMDLIAQQWLPPASETVKEYKIRMSEYLKRLAELNPKFINSHTGKDYFSFSDNCSVIDACFEIEQQTGIKLIHETHRGRFSHHAYTLLQYIQQYPDLALTGDFSHFCCVSESLLEDQNDIMDQIIPHCHYIHARVGFDQTAQVNHPFAPEWETNLNHFVAWWQQILDAAKLRGEDTFYICPEFGPYPYMPAVPFTQQPISNQWDINHLMMKHLKANLH